MTARNQLESSVSVLLAMQRLFAVLLTEPKASSPVANAVIAAGGNVGAIVANLQQAHDATPDDRMTVVTSSIATARAPGFASRPTATPARLICSGTSRGS